MFASIRHRLRERASFNENRKGFGRLRELRDAVEEYVLQYFLNNPHASTRAAANDLGMRNHVDVWHVLEDNHLDPYHF